MVRRLNIVHFNKYCEINKEKTINIGYREEGDICAYDVMCVYC